MPSPRPTRTPFGARLRALREEQGLTQDALAKRTGLTPGAISRLERGHNGMPLPQTMLALKRALNVPEKALTGMGPRETHLAHVDEVCRQVKALAATVVALQAEVTQLLVDVHQAFEVPDEDHPSCD